MFTHVMCLTAIGPAFAPAPVPRYVSVTGPLLGMGAEEPTITLNCAGKATVFRLARDPKVKINGQTGYSLDDTNDIRMIYKPIFTLTMRNGLAESLDITLTLRKGETLWRPGMGRLTTEMKRAKEEVRKVEERVRLIRMQQGKQGP